MLILPMSLLIIVIGILYSKAYPKEGNRWYGFRSKKSMKNDEIWLKAQLLFIQYNKIIFKYSAIFSIIFIVSDIVLIILKLEYQLMGSILIQTGIILILLGALHWIVDRKL
ncbi:hypothetical protein ABH521_007085 [Staphylococcus warneri]